MNDQVFATNSVIKLKTKLPTILILDVREFSTKDNFVEKIKKQNLTIKKLMEEGSEFSIVYSKSDGDESQRDESKHQIVA